MSAPRLAIAIPLAVAGLVGAQCLAPLPAAVAVGAGTSAATASVAAPAGSGTIPGALVAQDMRPQLQRRAAAGDFPTHAAASTTPPAGNISANLHFLSNLPLPSAIAVAFIGDVAYVSTVLGLYSVDISDPSHPQLLGAVPQYIWENEHMQADPARHLVFIARDPRGFTTPATTAFPYGALQVYDVSNPRAMVQLAFHLQPTGHTAGCINDCRFVWIAGPASPAIEVQNGANPAWGGRPMWGEDISDPANPVDCGHFLDLGNHRGTTDYDHDIDVDAGGVAWVSGSGHIRGYWTTGTHLNPLSGRLETASPCSPIPAAGANTDEGQILVQGGVMHNSSHNLTLSVDGRRGDVLTATEEVVTTDCAKAGHFLTYDLAGTEHGEGWTSSATTLRRLDAWTPQNQPGSTGCDSAHWFTDRGDGLIAIAFYSQGTRLLDVRDPRHITQVGYYNVSGTNTWAAYWHGHNQVVVADFQRGLDILGYDDPASTAGAGHASNAAGAAAGSSAGGTGVVSGLPDTRPAGGAGGAPGLLAGLGGSALVAAAGRHRRRRRRPGPAAQAATTRSRIRRRRAAGAQPRTRETPTASR